MAQRISKNRQVLPAAFIVLSAAVFGAAHGLTFANGLSQCFSNSTGFNESAKQTEELSPGWSEAEPWVRHPVSYQARFGGRQKDTGQARSQPSPETRANKHNVRPAESTNTATPANDPKSTTAQAHFSYEFTQPKFYVRHIFIEHDVNGHGKIIFERLNEETAYEEPLDLSPGAMARLSALWQALRFLDSDEDYQSDRQFPHLGTMRLKMELDSRKRTAEFNWTHNKDAFSLVQEYRRIADQAVLVFDISVARENQPLNGPKLMDQLESMLKRNDLSDPQQLVPLLKEITTDEHLPLMARNHAARLLKKIEK